ncbi:MAG: DUF3467 domain-containing protein [Pseudomonadota bacterium]
MSETEKQSEQRQQLRQQQTLPKRVALKDEPYYANCAMVQMTPFDLAILFGRITPVTNGAGQTQLAEVYDRQVYLSHLQAAALFDGLGRSLSALMKASRQSQTGELSPGRGAQAGEKEMIP